MNSLYKELSCEFNNLFNPNVDELLQPCNVKSIKDLNRLTEELTTFYGAFNRLFNANIDVIKRCTSNSEESKIFEIITNSICEDFKQTIDRRILPSDIPISLYVACDLDFIPINFVKMLASKGFTKLFLLSEPSDRIKSTLDSVKSSNRFFRYETSNSAKTPFDANYLIIVKDTKDLDKSCLNWNIDRRTSNVIIYKHYENLFSCNNKQFFNNNEVIDFETYNKVKCRTGPNLDR